jgi:protease-4
MSEAKNNKVQKFAHLVAEEVAKIINKPPQPTKLKTKIIRITALLVAFTFMFVLGAFYYQWNPGAKNNHSSVSIPNADTEIYKVFKYKSKDGAEKSDLKTAEIAVLHIKGIISGEMISPNKEEPAENMAWQTRQVLQAILNHPNKDRIKTLVLFINSGGGSSDSSDELYHYIKQWKQKTGIRVISYIYNIGASGAYWLALSGEEIVAHRNAVIGGIGVYIEHLDISGLLEKIGVESKIFKSAKHKGDGSSLRKLSQEKERTYQRLVERVHKKFLRAVVDSRKGITLEVAKRLATGDVYETDYAQRTKLIDHVLDYDHFLKLEADKINLSDYQIVKVVNYLTKKPEEAIFVKLIKKLL